MGNTPLLIVPRRGGSHTGRAAILTIVAAILVATLAVPVRAWFDQRDEIAGLEAEVASGQLLVEELRVEKLRWADPAFIAAEARRRLHFVRPGEIGYTTIGTEDLPEELAVVAVEELVPQLWYERLWSATAEADGVAESGAGKKDRPAGDKDSMSAEEGQ
ncbi:MAG: FtsB family cell division protein [Candidatus Nanopelagicales bacterium]